MTNRVGIIGGGNLGVAIAEGLVKSGFIKPEHIIVTRRNFAAIKHLEQQGILISDNNNEAVAFANVIVLAVKPFQVAEVIEGIKPNLTENHVLVSVVTGVTIETIRNCVGNNVNLVRAMPNTAIAIQESMTCLCFDKIKLDRLEYVQELFNQLGKVVVIDEKLMDAATVLGACGIAYALRYIRANIQGGIEIGFDAATASLIAAQTVKGAAELLIKTGRHPEQEIDKVTTPKGCTIAGLNEMEHQGFSSSLIKGISASFDKINHK
ncbi:MAG: pyrroline-5-carboxylate reductase [Chitinophagaceae bacterium]|nr:pyrroline-5-carboxylate reductase [Chitinophagaceae bacterium]